MALLNQDIIDCVVEHLKDDSIHLKTCAQVSHSFLIPSRRHLFFTVSLDQPSSSQRLYDVLTCEPELALLIRQLHVTNSNIKLFDQPVWFAIEKSLPGILRMVHHVQMMQFCDFLKSGEERVSWDGLSIELQSVFVERLQSPSLVELGIEQIINIPFSVVRHFTHLTRLSLSCDIFDMRSPQIFELMHLHVHALEVRFTMEDPTATSALKFISFLRLRHLFISSSNRGTLQAVEEVMHSVATSVNSITWFYHGRGLAGKLISLV